MKGVIRWLEYYKLIADGTKVFLRFYIDSDDKVKLICWYYVNILRLSHSYTEFAKKLFENIVTNDKCYNNDMLTYFSCIKDKDESEFDTKDIGKIIEVSNDLFIKSIAILTHNIQCSKYIKKYVGLMALLIGNSGGINYRVLKNYNEAFKRYIFALQIHNFIGSTDDYTISHLIEFVKDIVYDKTGTIKSVLEMDIEIANIEELLRYSLNYDDETFKIDPGFSAYYKINNYKLNIKNKTYNYLLITAVNEYDKAMPIVTENDNIIKLNRVLVLRIENDKSDYKESQVGEAQYFYNIVNERRNNSMTLKDEILYFDCKNNIFKSRDGKDDIEIKGQIYFEVRPKVLEYAKSIIDDIKSNILKVKNGEIKTEEFFLDFFDKIDMIEILPCVHKLDDMGFVTVAKVFENIDYNIFKFRLEAPMGITEIIKLIDEFYRELVIYYFI